jgi:alpha-mannosidase
MPSGPFHQQAQLFFYKSPNGKHIQIDITPDWQVSEMRRICVRSESNKL